MVDTNETSKALMSPEQQEEYDKILQASGNFVGAKKNKIFIPTIKLNNSDKTKKKHGIDLGNFFLEEKVGQKYDISDLGQKIQGIILKVSYSIKSMFDPDGKVYFYSREFDDFFEDEVIVLDGSVKGKTETLYQGSYKDWKDQNQITSSRGSKNDFELLVHLYVLVDGNLEDIKVRRLTLKGKSMSKWFSYVNGDKESGVKGIYDQGIQPQSAIHNFISTEGLSPRNEKYWFCEFSPEIKINLESLKKVFKLQQELDIQIAGIRGNKIVLREEKTDAPKLEEGEAREDEEQGDSEVRIEDVPF